MSAPLATYYNLAKPGIVYGNSLAVAAGFFLGARGSGSVILFLATLVGSGLVMASGCVLNNYLDRDIDRMMKRTKQRAMVRGEITVAHSMLFAAALGVAGLALLGFFTNWLTVAIGLVGLVWYVGIYGYWKRRSVHGTLVGSIAGAIPPVAGYCAVRGELDVAALILFMILAFWQMPHFYAIAMYRVDDYAAAKIPLLPIVQGARATKLQIITYTSAFLLACVALWWVGYVGYTYLVVSLCIGVAWLRLALIGLASRKDDRLWARQLFRFSLIVLLVQCILIAFGTFLP